jgi:hypothetical protein
MVTENSWTRPNRYRAEWPVLIASYASLQGIDGWNFFRPRLERVADEHGRLGPQQPDDPRSVPGRCAHLPPG